MFKKKGKNDKTDLKYTIGIIIVCIALLISIMVFIAKLNFKNNKAASEVGICDRYGEDYILIKSKMDSEESSSSHFEYFCCKPGGKDCKFVVATNK